MYPFHYQEYGKGQTVILLHGFAESLNIWTELISELDNQFHLIAIDLPGFGKTPIHKSEFQLKEIAVLLIEFLKEKGIGQFHLVGHSLGGYIALSMATLNSDIIKSMVLFHSTAIADSIDKMYTRDKIMAFIQKHGSLPFLQSFVPFLFYKPKQSWIDELIMDAKGINSELLIAYTQAMKNRPSFLALLPEFVFKIMIIAGENDILLPIETLDNQLKSLKNAHFLTLKEVGHMGMIEQPEICGKGLADFFNANN